MTRILTLGQLTWSGVDLFFVLSGFLIGGILLDARNSSRYFPTFYIRRAYRILPLYGLICALFLAHHLPFRILPGSLGSTSPLSIPWLSYVTFTQNFWMARLGWYGQMAMAVTWSLAVEEQFYLMAPFVIPILQGKWLLLFLASVIAGCPLLRWVLGSALPHGDFACYVLMPCRADALSMGVLTAYIVRQPDIWHAILNRRRTLWLTAAALALGVAFMTYRQYDQLSAPMRIWGYSWLAMFYTCFLVLAVSSHKGITARVLCNQQLRGLGTLAYCTYLLHFPLIGLGRKAISSFFPASPALAWLFGGWLGVAVTIALAMLSWKYFEQPLLRRGRRYLY